MILEVIIYGVLIAVAALLGMLVGVLTFLQAFGEEKLDQILSVRLLSSAFDGLPKPVAVVGRTIVGILRSRLFGFAAKKLVGGSRAFLVPALFIVVVGVCLENALAVVLSETNIVAIIVTQLLALALSYVFVRWTLNRYKQRVETRVVAAAKDVGRNVGGRASSIGDAIRTKLQRTEEEIAQAEAALEGDLPQSPTPTPE